MASTISATAWPPARLAQCSSLHDLLCGSVEPRRQEHRPGEALEVEVLALEYSATRAARCAERTEANVAIARMSVPPAVASDATVAQSVIRGIYRARQEPDGLAMLARILNP